MPDGGLKLVAGEGLERRRPGAPRYRHVATGRIYDLVTTATMEATGEPVVVYAALRDNDVWVRPAVEFFDGRFEPIDQGDC